MFKYSITLGLVFLMITVCLSQKERKYIRQGNSHFNKAYKDTVRNDSAGFNNAEIAYRKAIENRQDSYEASFNLGDALYKQEKFQDAANEFKVLANSQKDKTRLSQIYHNLGNSLLRSGKTEESIEAYKNALRNNPKDMETKYNLAFAQHMLKKQEQQQQQQQNQDQQDQGKQEQQKEQDKKEQEEKQDQQQQKQQQEQQISEEDAKRLLEALENDEKEVLEKLKKQQAKAKKVKIEKDW